MRVALVFLYSVMLGGAWNAQARVLDVCATCARSTVASALAEAVDGDEIVVKAGVYYEHDLVVDKAVTVRGEPGAVLDGQAVDGRSKGTILHVRANHVSIRSLTIRNVGQSHVKDFAAIKVHRVKDFTIEDNTLENVFFGVMLEKSKRGVVRGNKISSNAKSQGTSGNGIHVWHCSKIEVVGNELWGLRDGIYLEFVKHSSVRDNISRHNLRYGLHFMFSNHDDYSGNTFHHNGAGVAVMFSKFISMKGNTFRDNWGTAAYGLLLKEIYDAEIVGNVFERNTIAINTEGSTRIQVRHNNLSGNGWAVKVTGACYENIYRANNFLHNSFDVSYNSRINDNAFTGNHWSSYTGYDLDRDGVGDVPHRPVKLFSYIVNRTPEAIVLLRSLFVDIINFSEKVSPVFTPDDIEDVAPSMRENRVTF